MDLTRSQPPHQQVHAAQSQQPQYTPSSEISIDSLFSHNYQPEPNPVFSTPFANNNVDFTRRHSVAVSGGIADFNLRNLSQNMTFNQHPQAAQQQQPQQQQQPPQQRYPSHLQSYNHQQPPPIFARRTHQHLATVVEGEAPTPVPNMSHRASMPNIFLSEESRRRLTSSIQQRVESLSARTTPNNTPPPVSISFNQMPWSTPASTTNAAESRSNTNSPSQQYQDWNRNQEFVSPAPTPTAEDRPFVGRKRFYSQQFDSFPTNNGSAAMNVPFNVAPPLRHQLQPQHQQQISSNLCPLPMSGIMSRRASVATPHDISTWNRMVNPNDRITLDQQQQERKRQKQASVARVEDTNKDSSFLYQHMGHQHQQEATIKQEEYTDKSENTSLNGSVTTVEETTPTKTPAASEEEDYPVITEADLEAAKKDANAIPRRQKLRYEGDEYTPKWVRYTGQLKEGYCDTCKPGKWLQLKNSAFWYHKQFFHGISSVSGKPFQRPLEQRAGEHDVIEGLCHQCKQFVPICNSKRKNSVLWYRHAHKVSRPGKGITTCMLTFCSSAIFMINPSQKVEKEPLFP